MALWDMSAGLLVVVPSRAAAAALARLAGTGCRHAAMPRCGTYRNVGSGWFRDQTPLRSAAKAKVVHNGSRAE